MSFSASENAAAVPERTTVDAGAYSDSPRPSVTFTLVTPAARTTVWDAVATPAGLAYWFPARIGGQLRTGGELTFDFGGGADADGECAGATGQVLDHYLGERFAFTWGEDELHLSLDVAGGRRTLTLTNVLADPLTAARSAAGWAVCLDELRKHLDGQVVAGPANAPDAVWQGFYAGFVARGFPFGAQMPGAAGAAR